MTAGAPAPGSPPRGLWAGERWWLPGTAVASGAAVLGWVGTGAWDAFVAAGCGNPSPKFECMVETLAAGAAAAVLGPLLLWFTYRRAGVRRALLGVPVAAAVAFFLLALVELVAQVGVLFGRERTFDSPSGLVVGGVLGLAVLGGGLALTGPHRVVRAVVAALALGCLVAAVGLLQDPEERASSRLELGRAQVPLLVPMGWQVSSLYVGEAGDLSYDAVPGDRQGGGGGGVDMVVSTAGRHLDPCEFSPCTIEGDVRVEVPEPGTGLRSAWRAVDGVVVVATTYDDDLAVDLADLLATVEPVTMDEVVDRLYLH